MSTIETISPRFRAIMRLLGRRAGLSFRANDHARVLRGIKAAMQRCECQDTGQYLDLLTGNGSVWDDLIVELTVGETYFFREPGQFEFIDKEVLPVLLQNKAPGEKIRVWSAGCASGEEAYSLAMLFDKAGVLDRCLILGTDVSTVALARAQRAAYGDWSLRGYGASNALPYLRRQGELNVLSDHIRCSARFEKLNLADDDYAAILPEAQNFDLILCRNVLIYFDSLTVAAISRRLHAALAPNGWLITASTDPQLDDHAPYQPIVRDTGVYYRRGEGEPSGDDRSYRSSATSITNLEVPPAPDRPTGPPVQVVSGKNLAPPRPVAPTQDARSATAQGRSDRAVDPTTDQGADPDACINNIKAIANVDVARAADECRAAAERHPLVAHLHYLNAVLHAETRDLRRAIEAARRVIFLDRKLVMGHLQLGSILRDSGDPVGAVRALQRALELARSQPDDAIIEFSDGETAGRIAEAATLQIESIERSMKQT